MIKTLDIVQSITTKVKEEIDKGIIGPNRSCDYYHCHFDGQDCTFCYCPFYPCEDKRFGEFVFSKNLNEDVWSCQPCHMVHDEEIAEFIISEFRRLEITDPSDSRIKELFLPVTEKWLNRK